MMTKDGQGILRGACHNCGCRRYVPPALTRCEYCNHLPTAHEHLGEGETAINVGLRTTTLAPATDSAAAEAEKKASDKSHATRMNALPAHKGSSIGFIPPLSSLSFPPPPRLDTLFLPRFSMLQQQQQQQQNHHHHHHHYHRQQRQQQQQKAFVKEKKSRNRRKQTSQPRTHSRAGRGGGGGVASVMEVPDGEEEEEEEEANDEQFLEQLLPRAFLNRSIFVPPSPTTSGHFPPPPPAPPPAPAVPTLTSSFAVGKLNVPQTKRVKGTGTGDPKYHITLVSCASQAKPSRVVCCVVLCCVNIDLISRVLPDMMTCGRSNSRAARP